MIIGDYTTQYIEDSNNPIVESLSPSQYDGMVEGFWTLLSCHCYYAHCEGQTQIAAADQANHHAQLSQTILLAMRLGDSSNSAV